jgi:hypothetical protein
MSNSGFVLMGVNSDLMSVVAEVTAIREGLRCLNVASDDGANGNEHLGATVMPWRSIAKTLIASPVTLTTGPGNVIALPADGPVVIGISGRIPVRVDRGARDRCSSCHGCGISGPN